MVSMSTIRAQLKAAGFKNKWLGWSAIRELPAILTENEIVHRVASGTYPGGHAVMIATNRRILFLDKKPISFIVEDVPYDVISEVEYHINPFNANLTIHCPDKMLTINGISQSQIRLFAVFVQNQINEIRANVQHWQRMMNRSPDVPMQQPVQQPRQSVLGRPKFEQK